MDAKFKLNRPTRRICDVKHKNGILLRSNEPTQMWTAVVCGGHESAFGGKRTSRKRMFAYDPKRTWEPAPFRIGKAMERREFIKIVCGLVGTWPIAHTPAFGCDVRNSY